MLHANLVRKRSNSALAFLLPTVIALGLGAQTGTNANQPKGSLRPKIAGKAERDRQNFVKRIRFIEQPVRGSTPYDRYFGSVRSVLRKLDGQSPPTMAKVRGLMQQAFRFRYLMTSAYRPAPPAVVEKRRAGDCKDKALWLADRMNDPDIRYIIGKESQGRSLKHAWLLWRCGNEWWVLDPASTDVPQALGFGSKQHVPYYAYTREGAFRYRTPVLKTTWTGAHVQRGGRRRLQSAAQTRETGVEILPPALPRRFGLAF